MMLTRWTPFRELERFEPFERLLSETRDNGNWTPSVDIVERNDALVFRAELCGVGAAEIDVRVEDNTLHLSGERQSDVPNQDETARRRERFFGKFERRFRLPNTVDASKIEASHKDGVLEVVIPKLEQARPRKIEIRAA